MRKEIYKLGLHEWTQLECDDGALPFNTIMRVPGGWIYCQWENREQEFKPGSIFVPYSDDCDAEKNAIKQKERDDFKKMVKVDIEKERCKNERRRV